MAALCVATMAFLSSALQAQSSTEKRLSALWRSAVLPGWGQFYQGRASAGASYSGLFGLGVVLGVIHKQEYDQAARSFSQQSSLYTAGGLFATSQGATVTPTPDQLAVPLTGIMYDRRFHYARKNLAKKADKLDLDYKFLGLVYSLNLLDAWFLDDPPGRGSTDRLGAAWRSAVLPGWGQYYQGRTGTAYLYGAGFLTISLSIAQQTKEVEQRRNSYQEAADNFLLATPTISSILSLSTSDTNAALTSLAYIAGSRNASKRLDRSKRYLNNTYMALAAFYVWNVSEVFLFAPSSSSKVGLSVIPGGARLALTFRY